MLATINLLVWCIWVGLINPSRCVHIISPWLTDWLTDSIIGTTLESRLEQRCNPSAYITVRSAMGQPWVWVISIHYSPQWWVRLMIRYARTNARATSEEEVSFQTVSIVFQVCYLLASVLLYSCNRALWRCDMHRRKYIEVQHVSVWTCATCNMIEERSSLFVFM